MQSYVKAAKRVKLQTQYFYLGSIGHKRHRENTKDMPLRWSFDFTYFTIFTDVSPLKRLKSLQYTNSSIAALH